jgi:glycosyltransferase involved in cell wall biosynthesis
MPRARGELNLAAVSPALLWSLATRRDISLVHLHCHDRLTTAAAHVCWRRKLPFIYTIHSRYDPTRHKPLLGLSGLSYEWGVRRANRIIAVGSREARTLRSLYPDRSTYVVTIPNGVDTELFGSGDAARFRREYGIPPDKPLLVHVGRIYSLKNQIYSVRLLAEMKRGGLDAYLAIVGPSFDDVYFAELNREIDAQGLRSRVLLTGGLRPNDWRLPAAYKAADIALLPSEDEAQGLVLLEAWAAGVGVLASNIENLRDFITPGATGEFLPSDWSLRKAVDTVKSMLANKLRYHTCTRRAAEKYRWDSAITQIAECYSAVLAQSELAN